MPKPLRCAINKRPDFGGPHAAARTETRPVVIGIRVEFERGLPASGGQTSTQHSVVIAEACHCLRRHQRGVALRVRDCRMGDVCRGGLE